MSTTTTVTTNKLVLAGTGHRPDKLGGYGDDIYNRLVALATDSLIRLNPSHVISGMALGWDQALAEAALNLQLPVIAAVPFKDQERMWPASSQNKYHRILDRCTVQEVCPPGFAAWKMQRRNQWMVDNCDVLLALWNGSTGGTDNCIQYALEKERTIVNLWEVWEK